VSIRQATRQVVESNSKSDEHVVVFRLGNEAYAVDIGVVQEIVRMQPVTMIPDIGSEIAGVTSFRGRVIPVVDLRRACGVYCEDATPDSRIIVVSMDSEHAHGLIVDAVSEVLRIPASEIEPVTSVLGTSRLVRGIAKLENRLVALLNLDGVLPASTDIADAETESELAA